MPKYIFVDGVMKLDPTYQAEQAKQGNQQTVADPSKALAIVSSTQDIGAASAAQQAATGRPMQLSEATTASMEIMQDPDYLKRFNAPTQLDGGDMLDGLTAIFSRYEVPIGLVNKLLVLSEYKLNFIIDDSGSMGNKTDAAMSQATSYIRQAYDSSGARANSQDKMTRWEEAQDRIHVMIDMLAYIPTNTITINFMNRQEPIVLEHRGKTPDQFAREAHDRILRAFRNGPNGGTPIYKCLSQSFNSGNENTMHYLLTDGEPSDATTDQVCQLILQRRNPKMNPLSFITCTNDDDAAEWMKEIEEKADFTSELDDFLSERKEVLKDQGPGFPFSKGFWLICQLVAAINPFDLDALDESCPLSKKTMDDLLGRKLSPQEYFSYFDSNPNAVKYRPLYNQFSREDLLAKDVLRNAGLQPGQVPNPASFAQAPQQQPQPQQYAPAAATVPMQQPQPYVPGQAPAAAQNIYGTGQPAARPGVYAPQQAPTQGGVYGAAPTQTMWGQQPAYAPQSNVQQTSAPPMNPGQQPAYNPYRK